MKMLLSFLLILLLVPHTHISENISPDHTADTSLAEFGVSSQFQPYFQGKNTQSLYAATTALIVYVDKNGEQISDFSHIDEDSTAHIFASNSCSDLEKPLHLVSHACHHDFCEFDSLNTKTFEEQSNRIFGRIQQNIYHIDINEAEKFESGNEYLESLPEFEGWKPFTWNRLYHPESGKIPAIFSGRQDC